MIQAALPVVLGIDFPAVPEPALPSAPAHRLEWATGRHVALDTGGLLLGLAIRVARIPDAEGPGDRPDRVQPFDNRRRAAFADSIDDRRAALRASWSRSPQGREPDCGAL
jgi:hypothetical protein